MVGKPRAAQFALVALGAALVTPVPVIALHIASPEINPVTRGMSSYVNGRYGVLMIATFLLFTLSLFALAVASHRSASTTRQQLGGMLLATAGLCTLTAGIFPTDNTTDGSFNTVPGAIHAGAAYLLSPLMVSAILCLSGSSQETDDRRRVQRMTRALGILSTAAFVGLLVVNTIAHWPVGGIAQRIFMGLVCGWLALMSVGLVLSQPGPG